MSSLQLLESGPWPALLSLRGGGVSRIVETVRTLAEPIARELSLELFEVDYLKEGGNWILRVTIDSDNGISHAECEAMSRALEKVLDEQDVIANAYMLEVSSPGAERPLRSDRDFERFKNRPVLLKTFVPIHGQKEWKGTLLGRDEGAIRLHSSKGEMSFPRDQVSLVRLTID